MQIKYSNIIKPRPLYFYVVINNRWMSLQWAVPAEWYRLNRAKLEQIACNIQEAEFRVGV